MQAATPSSLSSAKKTENTQRKTARLHCDTKDQRHRREVKPGKLETPERETPEQCELRRQAQRRRSQEQKADRLRQSLTRKPATSSSDTAGAC